MISSFRSSLWVLIFLGLNAITCIGSGQIPVLIVDGQNNHDWQSTTDSLHATLQATNRFAVEVETAPQTQSIKGIRGPKTDAAKYLKDSYQNFRSVQKTADEKNKQANDLHGKIGIRSREHQAVVLNYNGREWAQQTKESAVEFVREGGGLVLVHAANNAFRNWDAYNEMIGLGWRAANFGDCIKWEVLKNRPFVTCVDCASGHGSRHPFQVAVRPTRSSRHERNPRHLDAWKR